jgi:polar amino acid transport system substrate-binding protein
MVGTMRLRSLRTILTVAAVLLLTACGTSFPADPDGTLDRVRSGTLRVGASIAPPWLEQAGDGAPTGREADLVLGFAESLNAEVEWETGGEEQLIAMLERGELDLVVGGLTSKSPWNSKVALTRPYTEVENRWGETEKHVFAAVPGENAFLLEVERHLLENGGRQ